MPTFTALIGLLMNLKYPKMNATNDTEVVKQSMSSMISVFIGIGIFIGSALAVAYLNKYLKLSIILIYIIFSIGIWISINQSSIFSLFQILFI